MALHRKREESGRVATRLLLESSESVVLPPAEEIDEEGLTLEREEFRQHLPDLLNTLEEGGIVDPAPIVQSDSLFIVEGETRVFWVRLWHTDESRTRIARMHVVSCLPFAPTIRVNLDGIQM